MRGRRRTRSAPGCRLPAAWHTPSLGGPTFCGAASAAPRLLAARPRPRRVAADSFAPTLELPRKLRLRNRTAPCRGPLAARRRNYESRRVVGGRHLRPSTRRIRAPRSAYFVPPPGPDFRNFSPPFGGPRGGAGARATRAPGRPRWVETGFGARLAPGRGTPLGVHTLACGNYTFRKTFPKIGPEPGPKCFFSNEGLWLECIASPETTFALCFAASETGSPTSRFESTWPCARPCAPPPRDAFSRHAAAPRGRRGGGRARRRARPSGLPARKGTTGDTLPEAWWCTPLFPLM